MTSTAALTKRLLTLCALLLTASSGCEAAAPPPPKPTPHATPPQSSDPQAANPQAADPAPSADPTPALAAAPGGDGEPLADEPPSDAPPSDAPPAGDTAEATDQPPPSEDPSSDPAAPEDKPSKRGSRQALRTSHLLDRLEVREVFGYDGTLSDAPFPGQEPSATYGAHRLQPADGKSLGFAVQLWKQASQTRALEQFEALFSQSVGGVKGKEVGDRSFRLSHHKVRSLVFLDQRHQAIVWLSCDEKLCSPEQLNQLAQRVRKRL